MTGIDILAPNVQPNEINKLPGDTRPNGANSAHALLRVAAAQLPKIATDDERDPDEDDPIADLLPHVKRDMGR